MTIISNIQKCAWLVVLLLACAGAQAQSSGMAIKARAFPDSIVVRWAPTDYATWRTGVENGYKLLVTEHDTLTGLQASYFIGDTIRPRPEGTWGSLDDEYMALGHALLYDFSTSVYEGPQGAYTQAEDRENRLNFMLFTADISLRSAQYMGLSHTLTGVDPNLEYTFQVFLVGTDRISYATTLYPSDIEPLPTPNNLAVEFNKHDFYLAWDKAGLEAFYTSYTIEYSDDMGATFQPMNDRPFVYFENEDVPTELQQQIVYKDSISPEVELYQFRVKGHTCFGETGPVSAIVSGRSVPDPLLVFPKITSVLEMADSSFQVEWTVNEGIEDSIVSFDLLRYAEFPGEGVPINPEPLSIPTRTYRDTDAGDVNFYQVVVTDIFGYRYSSALVLGQRFDSIPPMTPLGLMGVIDSLSDTTVLVRLSWQPNTETDLAGYYLFRGNGPDDDFIHLTTSGRWQDSIYLDTLAALTLADSVYYRIQALDFNGNLSAYSATYALARPDFLPPAPPYLDPLVMDDGGLRWMNSSSRDVVAYRIERRPANTEAWEVLETKAKSVGLQDKIASELVTEKERIHYYRVVAIDKVGWETPSNEVSVKESPMVKKFDAPFDFGLRSERTQTSVTLRWRNNYPSDIEKVIVYRSKNNGPLISLLHLDAQSLSSPQSGFSSCQDTMAEAGDNYLYKIQVKYTNGEYSNVSAKSTIQF